MFSSINVLHYHEMSTTWTLFFSAPQKCDAFFPTIVSNLRIITGACHVMQVRHERMRTLVRAAILWLRCLHACIIQLKSAYTTYVKTITLVAIMSLIALFRSNYCIYMRESLIAILSKSHYNRIKRVHVNTLSVVYLSRRWKGLYASHPDNHRAGRGSPVSLAPRQWPDTGNANQRGTLWAEPV